MRLEAPWPRIYQALDIATPLLTRSSVGGPVSRTGGRTLTISKFRYCGWKPKLLGLLEQVAPLCPLSG